MSLKSPFPYFGGKSKIAPLVWSRLGNTPNYVEPFLGSAAVLLARPDEHEWWERIETVNDADGYVANFWRALQADPEAIAEHADHPVFECDLHARHYWLKQQRTELVERLEGDPDYYDVKIAGWWVWGMACWIGTGFCQADGPWASVEGKLVCLDSGQQGVKRQLVYLGGGQGVKRGLVRLEHKGQGVTTVRSGLLEYMLALAERLRRVRVCCGDWTRVCGPTPTHKQGLTAVFLDPPYSQDMRTSEIYSTETDCSTAVREWAIEQGKRSDMRICLCGYDGEHAMPATWEEVAWKANGGYASRNKENKNRSKERLWFSPACLKPGTEPQTTLEFTGVER